MSKYSIDEDTCIDRDANPIIESAIEVPRIWWTLQLAHVVATSYRYRVYSSRDSYEVHAVFVGHKSDVTTATNIYEFFKTTAETLYSKHYYQCKLDGIKSSKKDYMFGFI